MFAAASRVSLAGFSRNITLESICFPKATLLFLLRHIISVMSYIFCTFFFFVYVPTNNYGNRLFTHFSFSVFIARACRIVTTGTATHLRFCLISSNLFLTFTWTA